METRTIDESWLRPRLLGRENESHKGNYGHVLIVAGCESMPGAAVLATGAALHSGCGLVTLHSTPRALQAVVNNYPSAMLSEAGETVFSRMPENINWYSAIVVGPGLGQAPETKDVLLNLLMSALGFRIPTVIDADALNILSTLYPWEELLPENTILTPHLGELKRLLFWWNDEEKDKTIRKFCERTGITLIQKGFHTRVHTGAGDCLVNTTGNPGLAKGGSGDVLAGLVGGLAARGYAPVDAAALGVWLHGLAGDILAAERTPEAFDSRDLIDALPLAFRRLYEM